MSPQHHSLQEADLVTFDNAAAGHEGVLSDPSGALVIKPCTTAEIEFYESAIAHPEFQSYMPAFMGTLSLAPQNNDPAIVEALAAATAITAEEEPSSDQTPTSSGPGTIPASSASSSTPANSNTTPSAPITADDDRGPLHGKKLDTGLAIVLENVAGDFIQPNILDVKLGAQLWDSDARPDKRARLDKVAAETTSSSLGFRIAGMKLYRGGRSANTTTNDESVESAMSQDTYQTYDKFYGRSFSAETVHNGFREYLRFGDLTTPSISLDGTDSKDQNEAKTSSDTDIPTLLATRFAKDVRGLQHMLEQEESRMYSASILFVYEGDDAALRTALQAEEQAKLTPQPGSSQSNASQEIDQEQKEEELEEDDDDEDEEDGPPPVHVTKLIDFAHARWTPGQGPDENALHGVRSVADILEKLSQS